MLAEQARQVPAADVRFGGHVFNLPVGFRVGRNDVLRAMNSGMKMIAML